jgi:hypothetical protein
MRSRSAASASPTSTCRSVASNQSPSPGEHGWHHRHCGNFGGYQPYTASELARRYGTAERYEQRARSLINRLVRQGYLLRSDGEAIVDDLRQRYHAAH